MVTSNTFQFIFSMEGGELFARIQERADSAFTERGRFFILS